MDLSGHSAGDDEKPWIFLGVSMDESCIFGPQMHERTWREKFFVMHLCAAPSAHSHPVIKQASAFVRPILISILYYLKAPPPNLE